jgi:hypothetical protein
MGSGAFLTPGSGMDKKNQDPDPIPYPDQGWIKNQDPDPGS